MRPRTLLGVPNVSEGLSEALIGRMAEAIVPPDGEGTRLLDIHSDGDHDRSVFSFASRPRLLSEAILRLAAVAVEEIDLTAEGRVGQHPHVGALDVAPVVYLRPEDRGAACAEALLIGERIGIELGVPVFLYGELTAEEPGQGRTRAWLRRGGLEALTKRMEGPEGDRLRPDFGPPEPHPRAGVTLVSAREPLVAFNLRLARPATLADARRVAAMVREGGESGLPGLRAIGIELVGGVAQVSMNIERPLELKLAEVLAAVAAHAEVLDGELVGLAPAAALEGFPAEVVLQGFDPAGQVIEKALGS